MVPQNPPADTPDEPWRTIAANDTALIHAERRRAEAAEASRDLHDEAHRYAITALEQIAATVGAPTSDPCFLIEELPGVVRSQLAEWKAIADLNAKSVQDHHAKLLKVRALADELVGLGAMRSYEFTIMAADGELIRKALADPGEAVD